MVRCYFRIHYSRGIWIDFTPFKLVKLTEFTLHGYTLDYVRYTTHHPPPITPAPQPQVAQKKGLHPAIIVLIVIVALFLVIAVIGILAGLLIPTVAQVQNNAERVKSANNVRQLSKAMLVHAIENDSKFPKKGDFKTSDELFNTVILGENPSMSESIFWIKTPLSPKPPAEDGKLESGENVYLYVADQSQGSSPPTLP